MFAILTHFFFKVMSFSKINIKPICQNKISGYSLLVLDTFEWEWLLNQLVTFTTINYVIKSDDQLIGINNRSYQIYISNNPSGSKNILVICRLSKDKCKFTSNFLGWTSYKITSIK